MPDLTLRAATIDDAPRILAWRNEPTTVRFSGTRSPISDADHLAWLSRRLSDPDTRIWIADVEGVEVGQVRLERHGDGAEVHIAVAPEARGRGYGRTIIRAVQLRTSELEGIVRLVGRVHVANAASMRLFAHCGFEQVSVEGEFAQFEWLCEAPQGSG
jgi:RimJ/RimL family protein N-acetyltransferase